MGRSSRRREYEIERSRLGREMENRAHRAIGDRIGNGFFPSWVRGYVPATPDADERGIDGWFITQMGYSLYTHSLQIKISSRCARGARGIRPDIPVVVLNENMPDELIASVCFKSALRLYQ